MYPLTFYPLLWSLLRTACFSLLVLKFLFFTPHLCRPSNNHSGLWEQQCRMKGFGAARLCWHRGTMTHQGLQDQASQLAICINNFRYHTHVCVYKNNVGFFIYICIHKCFGGGIFFYLEKKQNFWNLFSLNWSAAHISVLQRWWSGWMNPSGSNDLLH